MGSNPILACKAPSRDPKIQQKGFDLYIPPPVTLELLLVRPALEHEGSPADKVEVTVELFGIPLPPWPPPPFEDAE